jgi:hypothetical protein
LIHPRVASLSLLCFLFYYSEGFNQANLLKRTTGGPPTGTILRPLPVKL